MKAILGRLSVLVLAAGLVGAASMTGCSSSTDDPSQGSKDQGSISFNLDVGGGATINTIHVVVYGNSLGAVGAATNIVRDLDVGALSGPSAAFTLTLPAGTNYQVKVSSPDNTTCGGTGTFSVIAGQSNGSTLNLTLSCASTDTTGGETVNVTACTPPVVNSVFVGPNTQAVGHNIQLVATVETGSVIQWAQSGAGAGTFGSSSAASTNFTCTSGGAVTLQLALTKNGCSTTKSYAVSCVGAVTGAGGSGAGGASAGTGGTVSVAGAPAGGSVSVAGGGAGGTVSVAGAPAGGSVSVAGGGAGGSVAGGGTGGLVAGAGGSVSGAGGAAAGSGGSGGSTVASCPNPNIVIRPGTAPNTCTTAYSIDECGANCAQLTSTACRACELADTTSCYDDSDNTDGSSLLDIGAAMTFYGGNPTPARIAAGVAAEACIYSSGCGKAAGQIFTTCYCGTAGATCNTPGAANGPCKAQLEAALETTTPGDIGMRIGDPTYPGGIAQIRIACDKTQCASTCLP